MHSIDHGNWKKEKLKKKNYCPSPVAQGVKNPATTQETQEMWVQPLGWEDPLEKEMGTCPMILAWKTPWTEEPGGLQSKG